MTKSALDYMQILQQFELKEKPVAAQPFGNGHINDTLKISNDKGEDVYILQRINHNIFPNVDMLQNNIQIVTAHIRKKLEESGEKDIDRKVLTFLPTKDGKKQVRLLVTFSLCWLIFLKERWVKQLKTSIIWSSAYGS